MNRRENLVHLENRQPSRSSTCAALRPHGKMSLLRPDASTNGDGGSKPLASTGVRAGSGTTQADLGVALRKGARGFAAGRKRAGARSKALNANVFGPDAFDVGLRPRLLLCLQVLVTEPISRWARGQDVKNYD